MKRIRSVHKPKRIIAILAALFFLTISISSFVIIHITSRKNKLNPIQQTSNSLRFLTISTHLGLVPVGSNRRISFGYKNVTDQEITIETVKKSCACVADIIFPQEAILPGKEGTIEMDYRAGEGKKMYALLVVLSSGESQVLTISSEGYYDIKLSTKQIELPPFAQNTGGKRSVVINGDRDIFDVNSIKIATDTPNWLQLKIAKIEDNAAEAPFTINNHKETKLCPMARIEILIRPGAPLGRFSKHFVFDIASGGEKKRELTLKCIGEVVPEVSSIPARVIMLDRREPVWEQVIIRSINEPFKIRAIDAEYIECDYSKSKKTAFTVQIKIRKKSKEIPANKDCISVYIEHPTISRLDIPVLLL